MPSGRPWQCHFCSRLDAYLLQAGAFFALGVVASVAVIVTASNRRAWHWRFLSFVLNNQKCIAIINGGYPLVHVSTPAGQFRFMKNQIGAEQSAALLGS